MKYPFKRTLVWLIVAAFLSSQAASAARPKSLPPKPETKAERDARMKWWREARFGMFVHWGLYAALAGDYKGQRSNKTAEWIMAWANIPRADYEKFAAQFNPVKFNAAEFVRIAKDAGMKYIVITSKHHEGFAMFDSKVSQYDIVEATPYHKDPLKALAMEAKKQGIKLCFYYSISIGTTHPNTLTNPAQIPQQAPAPTRCGQAPKKVTSTI